MNTRTFGKTFFVGKPRLRRKIFSNATCEVCGDKFNEREIVLVGRWNRADGWFVRHAQIHPNHDVKFRDLFGDIQDVNVKECA